MIWCHFKRRWRVILLEKELSKKQALHYKRPFRVTHEVRLLLVWNISRAWKSGISKETTWGGRTPPPDRRRWCVPATATFYARAPPKICENCSKIPNNTLVTARRWWHGSCYSVILYTIFKTEQIKPWYHNHNCSQNHNITYFKIFWVKFFASFGTAIPSFSVLAK